VLLVGCSDYPDAFQLSQRLAQLGFRADTCRTTDLEARYDSAFHHGIVLVLNDTKVSADLESINRIHTTKVVIYPQSQSRSLYQSGVKCADFLVWPCVDEEFRARMLRAFSDTREDDDSRGLSQFNLYGESPKFLECVSRIRKFAKVEAPVFIEGETGTGKELVASAIHQLSPRGQMPFIPVNCGAIPDSLLENELFGHVKGAFTDAKQSQNGYITQAEGGTLFLDEVDALSPRAQVALLRYTQDQCFTPLGSHKIQHSNVRIIVACNQNIERLVEAGTFRCDLWFRLNVMHIYLPALRERAGDTVILAEHFLSSFQKKYADFEKKFHPDTLLWLDNYSWPGNVRELENFVHREFLLSDGPWIKAKPFCILPEHQSSSNDKYPLRMEWFHEQMATAKSSLIEHFEREYVRQALRDANGNVSQAARRAGKERRAFGKLMKKYSIDRDDFST